MRTYKGLYPEVISAENLLLAWRRARRGKRYKPTVAAFEQNLDRELVVLQRELESQTYRPGPYRRFTVHDPKRRKISAASFRDRVVHHSLCNVIEPIYERKFIYDSYANRVGKGTHRALDRCTYFMRRFRFVLPMDVRQFFPSIDHDILKETLSRTLQDRQVLWLCNAIVDSGCGILDGEYSMVYFPGDDLFAANRPRGLPIGNQTSQFWANVYLNGLDQFIKHQLRAKGYLRYVDDMLLFADNRATLHSWRADIIGFLARLRLTVHEQRSQPRPVGCGIPFLGFTVYPDHRRLKRATGIAYGGRLSKLYRGYLSGQVSHAEIEQSIRAWIGHAQHGDTWGLRSKMLAQLVF